MRSIYKKFYKDRRRKKTGRRNSIVLISLFNFTSGHFTVRRALGALAARQAQKSFTEAINGFSMFLELVLAAKCSTKNHFGSLQTLNQNLNFLIFSKNSFRIELHTPFLPYFDTQHLLCKKLHFVCRGVPDQKN